MVLSTLSAGTSAHARLGAAAIPDNGQAVGVAGLPRVPWG
jgi:hypothetical protein